MNKLILLFLCAAALHAQAEEIKITRVSNLGAVSIDLLIRVRADLKVNGTLIRPDLTPIAAPAFRQLRPTKTEIQRTNFRCAAGSYEIETKKRKETGCLEDPRAEEIAKALSLLNRLELFSQAVK